MTNGNDSIHNSEQGPQDGLTKLEYFAAMALQGALADSERIGSPTNYARDAVIYADALIKALNESI